MFSASGGLRSRAWVTAVAIVLAVACVATAAHGVDRAAAEEPEPVFLSHVGRPGHAGVYAWGMATATDGSILVGDYWNYQIRRFSPGGDLLQTFSEKGTDPGQNMAPHGLAVDPASGDIYVADQNWPWKIHRFTADGTFLNSIGTFRYGITTPYPYVTRVQVLSDGTLLALSSHNVPSLEGFAHKVLRFAPTGAFLGAWGTFGSAPGQLELQRGFVVGPGDEVYLGDATKHAIQVFTSTGTYLRTIGEGRFNGDMRGLAIDADNGWLYAVDANNSEVEKFTLDGTYLGTFGSEGTGPGQFTDGGREITVGHDHRVYVADFGANRVNVYEPDGSPVGHFPDPAIQPPPGGLNQPQDVAVSTDGSKIFVVDTYNHRVHRFAANGDVDTVWGVRSSTGPEAMNYPRGATVFRNEVLVMNSREGNVKIYDTAGRFVRELGQWGRDPGQTNLARGIHTDATGRIYVADSNNRRLQVWDRDGNVVFTVPCGAPPPPPPSIALLAGCTGVDTDSKGNIYAAAPTEHTVYKLAPDGTLLGKFGTKGSAPGQLRSPYDVALRGNRLYVTESNNQRISVFTLAGQFLDTFGTRGDGDGQFEQPRGIDIDNHGRVYVVDGKLERVSVFQL